MSTTSARPVDEVARGLLLDAIALYRDAPRITATLRARLGRLDEPLTVAVIGRRAAGKTTLVGALEPGDGLRFLDTPPGNGDPLAHRRPPEADAVICVVRRLDPLEPTGWHGGGALAQRTMVGAVLALSRADEPAGSPGDALRAARALARHHWREDPACLPFQEVVAVAGLAGRAARTLRDDEFVHLALLASLRPPELDRCLASVEAFLGPRFPVPLDAPARRGLLDRFGLGGVRLAAALAREGHGTPRRLAGRILQRSGVGELDEAVRRYFAQRREVLKARGALLALHAVLTGESRADGAVLAAEVERLIDETHEFRELRLIPALRSGRVVLPHGLHDEALRLLGWHGTRVADRLGLTAGEDQRLAWSLAMDVLGRWRRFGSDPAHGIAERWAARIVVESCEEILARFG